MQNMNSYRVIYMMPSYKTIVISLFLALLTACATVTRELDRLDDTMRLYERALRWQNYDAAISLHRNEQENMTAQRRESLKRIRVTAYNEVYRKLENNGQSAEQMVEIKYYNDEYAVVRSLTLKNQWELDKQSQRWYLTNPFPAFR